MMAGKMIQAPLQIISKKEACKGGYNG